MRPDPLVGRVVVGGPVRRGAVVEGVALGRDPAGRADHPHQLGQLRPVPGARRGDHVLLQHDRTEVVHAHVQRELPDVLARGQPGGLQVVDVVEEQPGHRDEPQVLQAGALGAALEVVVLRLVRPGDEGPEPAGAVLHVADHPDVVDPLGVGFAGTHHHRRGRLDAQPVRDLHHLQPAPAGLLERGDGGARTVGQHKPTDKRCKAQHQRRRGQKVEERFDDAAFHADILPRDRSR